ncbi:MAG: hypothetical protein COY38_04110 [Candidatus Aenigmarchaeota archaeon CG_4_10_14_0_8_um_filter_37_24]|nr:hypothetical protein [Candidatus Aenigmarchaeota archaeon]OIN85357.1 MAG: hypothetical protein AUJ50_05290 [Candidatus Aenigmarchaeota archaeon CG1_02_38_14]PIV69656.1 MAG: hypothetical protein COS07_00010 [Candidatus Aenigmarchaeota archaeon CG01_land_8_20_14_3_00_37_9]PIW41259.1 MAG: hypothetical protein COW21_02845 [Candidatus Aenigmarchaeota archaeon CG15_BIG_FIL_POST_REV_8_21_14_020_37_27]PIX51176.1 MAG: hypothetical protein COZ52_00360 [Candidatus Aenigmarchaeota archaeon CG_4_8_14_3_u
MNNKKLYFGLFLLLIILAIGLIVLNSKNSIPVEEIENEEYTIYSSLIDGMYATDQVDLIVIMDHASLGGHESLDQTLNYVSQQIPEIEKDTLDDYKIKNTQNYPLENSFNIKAKVILISQVDFDRIFRPDIDGWEQFYKIYPKSQGIMTLSRVGFNKEKDQALVYAGNQAHYLAGRGYYVLLTKENDIWGIKKDVMTWIS